MSTPQLYLNHAPGQDNDWLIALEFGAVDDGLPRERRRILSETFCYVLDRPGGREIGFTVLEFSSFDPDAPEQEEIWQDPRFDVPALELRDVSAGEIIIAARTFFAGEQSINRFYFDRAVESEGEEAALYWRACLQAGDSMAHYGLGYTLVNMGRPREGYRHLRAYTELDPSNPWAWCWRGQACEALGDLDEARAAYERAVELEWKVAMETDAGERLEALA